MCGLIEVALLLVGGRCGRDGAIGDLVVTTPRCISSLLRSKMSHFDILHVLLVSDAAIFNAMSASIIPAGHGRERVFIDLL